MKLKTSKLRNAITLALFAGASSVAGTGVALAQESQSGTSQATELDTITVTGSRIKSQTFTASSPITEITAEEFKHFGATNVDDLVNQYPQVDMVFDNFQNNGSWGHPIISMRGLGPDRTLTLVNGRRLPFSRNEVSDPSIVPTAMIKRVDILSGGASAVYGADAVAGVVNFVLDDKFEGISLSFGYSAFQHDNDNRYWQQLNEEAGYEAPSGNSGFDGISRNVDVVVGGSFADNRGHAVGWVTWRENDPLYHGQRDYSHCSVFFDEPVCGGSGTAHPGRFTVADLNPDGTQVSRGNFIWNGSGYEPGVYLYNYAPINFYQRPDKRITAGFMGSFEINEHFVPYVEAMFLERTSSVQIAESGAFGVPVNVACDNPLIGTLCADAGVASDTARVTIWKRNVEGGPRISESDDNTHRLTAGVRGSIFDSSWNYDVSLSSGKTKTTEIGKNDFLMTRIAAAALGCVDPVYGTFPGCELWDVWTDNIDPETAQAMAGTSFSVFKTSLRTFSVNLDGYLGWGFPTANGEEIGLAVGMERRDYSYYSEYDTDSAMGNFAGAGAASLPVNASNRVNDFYVEAALPIYVGDGAFNRFDASLGYRYSDDETAGDYDTYKAVLSGAFWDNKLLVRGGYNRAVRAPSLNDMYYPQRIALNSGGTDLCAGPNPAYTAEQCARAGVPLSMYGLVPANPANQYYNVTGGNPNLKPEEADTYTFGFAVEPIENLNISLDWYSIKIEGAIGGIGYNTIQILCMEQNLYCDRINRDARAGQYDLWIAPANDPQAGHINNLPDNIGVYKREGLDLSVAYSFPLGPGRLSTSLAGNYLLKDFTQTLDSEPSTAFDCKGLVNDTFNCQSPKWRHVATARYTWDRYAVGLRWRHIGSMKYQDVDGTPLDNVIWFGSGVGSYNYIDLTGSMSFGNAEITLGVNNIADKEPPFSGDSGLSANANALGGYDQAGRYIFGNITLRF